MAKTVARVRDPILQVRLHARGGTPVLRAAGSGGGCGPCVGRPAIRRRRGSHRVAAGRSRGGAAYPGRYRGGAHRDGPHGAVSVRGPRRRELRARRADARLRARPADRARGAGRTGDAPDRARTGAAGRRRHRDAGEGRRPACAGCARSDHGDRRRCPVPPQLLHLPAGAPRGARRVGAADVHQPGLSVRAGLHGPARGELCRRRALQQLHVPAGSQPVHGPHRAAVRGSRRDCPRAYFDPVRIGRARRRHQRRHRARAPLDLGQRVGRDGERLLRVGRRRGRRRRGGGADRQAMGADGRRHRAAHAGSAHRRRHRLPLGGHAAVGSALERPRHQARRDRLHPVRAQRPHGLAALPVRRDHRELPARQPDGREPVRPAQRGRGQPHRRLRSADPRFRARPLRAHRRGAVRLGVGHGLVQRPDRRPVVAKRQQLEEGPALADYQRAELYRGDRRPGPGRDERGRQAPPGVRYGGLRRVCQLGAGRLQLQRDDWRLHRRSGCTGALSGQRHLPDRGGLRAGRLDDRPGPPRGYAGAALQQLPLRPDSGR